MFIILLVLLACIIVLFVRNFKKMDDMFFLGLSLACLIILWLVIISKKQGYIESFNDTEEGSSSEAPPAGGGIDFNVFKTKLFQLPKDIGEVLLPNLDYAINSLTGKSDGNEDENEDEEEVEVDEEYYLNTKDPHLTRSVNSETVVDKEKLADVREQYTDADAVFKLLRKIDKDLYETILQNMGKTKTTPKQEESIEITKMNDDAAKDV